jgi:lipoprotein NlpD
MTPVPRVSRSASGRWLLACIVAAAISGCGAPGPLIPEQREGASAGERPPPAPTVYRVERGDTLYSIAFRFGLDWRRVAAWNDIGAPFTIRVGDAVRLRPPPDMRPAVARRDGAGGARQGGRSASESEPGAGDAAPEASPPQTRPTPDPAPDTAPEPPSGPAERSSPSGSGPEPSAGQGSTPSTGRAPAEAGSVPDAPTRSSAGVRWRWPTDGRVSKRYDASAARKGILVAGDEGQAVRAAADGQVVYSGDGLIGYGQLIIIKHSESMLSAYAHNRERLVAEGDRVRAGQRIATMGRNERDESVLHFEIRRDGKPDDPTDYLPAR